MTSPYLLKPTRSLLEACAQRVTDGTMAVDEAFKLCLANGCHEHWVHWELGEALDKRDTRLGIDTSYRR